MTQRSTTVRDRDRAAIRRTKPPCALCGGDIDYTLRYPHLDSFVVDHIVPLAKGGLDELSNKQAAHSRCNRAKSDRLATELEAAGPRTFTTHRDWWTARPQGR
jgi:5-methylcytosine-specific restriction endonuclease McrA